jgi:aspartate racemase
MVFPFVQPKIDIPVLHIADAIGKEASKKELKTLGLLGNRPTMKGDFLSSHLSEKYDINTLIPDDEYIDKCHHFVSNELTQGIFSKEARDFFLKQMQKLRKKGAEGIILGCTELPMLLSENDFDLPMIATTQLHAQMAADFILGN